MKHILKKTLLIVALLAMILTLSACGRSMEIDLQQYIHAEISGSDGYGYGYAYLDSVELEVFVLSNSKENESELAQLAKLALLDDIKYELDKTENLSNGDKVTVTVSYPDSLEDALDADITPKSGESWIVEVSGLGEAEKVDVFEDITLEYGAGNTLCADGMYKYLNYTLSQSRGLSNGDTVTITVSAPDGNTNLESYCMDAYGWMPLSDSCEYTQLLESMNTPSVWRIFLKSSLRNCACSPRFGLNISVRRCPTILVTTATR